MRERVRALIEAGGRAETLALELFEWQRARVPHYAAFCGDARPETLEQIPAVPVELFRDLRFCISESPSAIFRTSGTTTGRRGEHAMPDAEIYELAARRWFRALLPACPTDSTLSLVTDPNDHPDSSLGHMIRDFAPAARWFFSPSTGLDSAGAWEAICGAEGPVFLPATAFALDELLAAPGQVQLAEGSVIMVTGGFKGRRTQLDPKALSRETRRRFGPAVQLVGEYGMTELSSQLWDLGEGFLPPPWLHVYTVDPISGVPRPGEEGLLCFVDIANWGSCLAIETRDLGLVSEGRVQLRGRLSGASPRGCSLSVEESRHP